MIFMEEEAVLWTAYNIPRYSKIVVNENSSVIMFIIAAIEEFKDSRTEKTLFYKCSLVPSSSAPSQSTPVIMEAAAVEEELISNVEFDSSITGINSVSSKPPKPDRKYNKV